MVKRRLPGYADVVSTLCLFLLLAGGTAYASHLVVNGSDVVDGTIYYGDVADGSLTRLDLAAGSIGGSDVAGGAVDASRLWRPPWLTLPLSTTATAPASGYAKPGYMRDGWDTVHLKGRVRSVNAPDACTGKASYAQLPPDYRPAARQAFVVLSSSGAWRVDVFPSGRVTWPAIPTRYDVQCPWISLDGVAFRAG